MVNATTNHKMMSFLDAFLGYKQIKMDLADEDKTFFFITERGTYCYKDKNYFHLLFRFMNTRATYQRLMNKMFSHYMWKSMEVFIGDILVKFEKSDQNSKTWKKHLRCYTTQKWFNQAKCLFGVIPESSLNIFSLKRVSRLIRTKWKRNSKYVPPRNKRKHINWLVILLHFAGYITNLRKGQKLI